MSMWGSRDYDFKYLDWRISCLADAVLGLSAPKGKPSMTLAEAAAELKRRRQRRSVSTRSLRYLFPRVQKPKIWRGRKAAAP